MPSPEHEAYLTSLSAALSKLSQHPDNREWIRNNVDIISILMELDIGAAIPILQAGYAPHSRGGKPWIPLLLLRMFLLAALTGHLAINTWAKKLRESQLLRALAGITDEHLIGRMTTSPAVGVFYGFLHRIHDGNLRNHSSVEETPSERERRRASSKRPSQKAEKEMKPKRTETLTKKLLRDLRKLRENTAPDDFLHRLHSLLMNLALKRSAQEGLLGDLSNILSAGDGCVLPTNATGRGHRVCECTTFRCDCEKTYADPDARWGYDSYRECFFFGHHFYEICAPGSGHDLPLFLDIHSGNTTDFTASMEAYEYLAKSFREAGEGWTIKVAALDAGHDALAIHEGLRDWEIRPVIPLRERKPGPHPERPELSLSKRAIPLCEAGVEMSSRGSAAPDRPIFICPVKAGKLETCPLAPEDSPDWVCSDLKWGPSITVNTKSQPRLFPEISRNSPQYKELYARRSGCERSNSLKKEKFKLLSCGHRRQSFWLFRLYTMAILQHVRVWISGMDLEAFLDSILSPPPAPA